MATIKNTIGKTVKTELTKIFPGIKFSVKYSSYSGGNSLNISWDFGPTIKEVEAIVNKYQAGNFNGMEDIYEYSEPVTVLTDKGEIKPLERAKYVMTSRNTSDNGNFKEDLQKAICARHDVEYNGPYTTLYEGSENVQVLAHRILYNASFKTSTPTFKGLGYLQNNGHHLENKLIILSEETVNGQTITTDFNKLEVEHWEQACKYWETKYFEKDKECSQFSSKYYNLQREFLELKKAALKPVQLDVTEKRIYITEALKPYCNKPSSLKEVKQEIENLEFNEGQARVKEIIFATDELYDFMAEHLSENFDFLSGKGGTDSKYKLPEEIKTFDQLAQDPEMLEAWRAQSYCECILIYHPTKELFLINPEGYNYARYVYGIKEDTQQKLRTYIESI